MMLLLENISFMLSCILVLVEFTLVSFLSKPFFTNNDPLL